ncbi:MAG: hypothetical protein E6Q84_03690 [Thiothrix sp.]|nr:MAG: hypothetical protein E6Q84_03690 [Thiothrix sp.]
MANLKVVGAGDSIQWYKGGWTIFRADIANWVLMALIFGVIAIVLSFIPFIGALVLNLIAPLFIGGMLYAAQKSDQGQATDIMDIFSMFKDEQRRTPLMILGLVMLGLSFVFMMIVGGAMFASVDLAANAEAVVMPSIGMGWLLIAILIGILSAMLFFFAIPLVMFQKMSAIEAIKTSFMACTKNFPAFIVFMLIYVLLAIIASIPFGLGFLVLLPVMVGALYIAYKHILA